MTTLFSTEPLGSEEVISGWGSLPSLEAGTLASRFIVSQSAVKARFPALPEVVAQPFPGRLVLEKDSKWVVASAAPHGGSGGGPGPHLGKENTGAEKGPGSGSKIREEAALAPHPEGVPGLQDHIDPHLPFSTERKKR